MTCIDRKRSSLESEEEVEDKARLQQVSSASLHLYMIGFSDLGDLWVIKTKQPMILCARNTSRSSEQRTRRRSRNERMRKVCLFCSQNNKIV